TTGDAGNQCVANDGGCTMSSQCCSMTCNNGVCGPARVCQPLGGIFSANADCCLGGSCVVPAGANSGTCQAPACVSVGQTCTAGGWTAVELAVVPTAQGLKLSALSTRGEGSKAPRPVPELGIPREHEAAHVGEGLDELAHRLSPQGKTWLGGKARVRRGPEHS